MFYNDPLIITFDIHVFILDHLTRKKIQAVQMVDTFWMTFIYRLKA